MLKSWVPLETNRLLLRPFTFADEESVSVWHATPALAKHIGGLKSKEQAFLSLAIWIRRFQQHGWGFLALQEKEKGVPVGWCGLQPLPSTPDFELSYGLHPDFWGRGYATEGCSALIKASLAAWSINRIVARVDPANYGSQRVLTKLGMEKVQPVFSDIYGSLSDFFVLPPATKQDKP